MKQMYWRPRRVSRLALALIAIVSLGGFFSIERLPTRVQEPYYQQKLAAAQLAEAAFKSLRDERLKRRIPIYSETDPARSGLIGSLFTPVTTNSGSIAAKQTSVNPNFAAVVVHYLKEIGLGDGDIVAIGYSGSFPALNTCVVAAIETLKLRAIPIASTSSSQWGANEPYFLWLDMEAHLAKRNVFSTRSVAASMGGIEDKGLGLSQKGRRMLRKTIDRHGLPLIETDDFLGSVEERMRLYRFHAGSEPIKAYINVGGGSVSVGRRYGKKLFRPGLNRQFRPRFPFDSVMGRFLKDGIPAIHMARTADLAARFGFPEAPPYMPAVGQGTVFFSEKPNKLLAGALLLALLAALYLFVRTDIGFRMTQATRSNKRDDSPEPMV